MNQLLLAHAAADVPEQVQDAVALGDASPAAAELHAPVALAALAVSRRGTHAAVARAVTRPQQPAAASVAILDLLTLGTVKTLALPACAAPVTTLSWSASGRYLLSAAAAPGGATRWDFAAPSGHTVLPPATAGTVLCGEMHPTHDDTAVLCPTKAAPLIYDFSTDTATPIAVPGAAAAAAGVHITAVAWRPRGGRMVLLGTAKGALHVYSVAAGEVVTTLKATAGAAIKQIVFNRKGTELAVNSGDRIIRRYRIRDDDQEQATPGKGGAKGSIQRGLSFELDHRFQEPISRLTWLRCGFSHNGDYVFGGAASATEHKIFVWDNFTGRLMTTLEGPKDGLGDVRVYVWSNYRRDLEKQQWASFFDTSGFVTIDENRVYQEREDEFDIRASTTRGKQSSKLEDDDEDVDVVTVDKLFASDSEDSGGDDAENTPPAQKRARFLMPINPHRAIDEESVSM